MNKALTIIHTLSVEELITLRRAIHDILMERSTVHLIVFSKGSDRFKLNKKAKEFVKKLRSNVDHISQVPRNDPVLVFAVLFLGGPMSCLDVEKVRIGPHQMWKVEWYYGKENVKVVEVFHPNDQVIPSRPSNLYREVITFANDNGITISDDWEEYLSEYPGPYGITDTA